MAKHDKPTTSGCTPSTPPSKKRPSVSSSATRAFPSSGTGKSRDDSIVIPDSHPSSQTAGMTFTISSGSESENGRRSIKSKVTALISIDSSEEDVKPVASTSRLLPVSLRNGNTQEMAPSISHRLSVSPSRSAVGSERRSQDSAHARQSVSRETSAIVAVRENPPESLLDRKYPVSGERSLTRSPAPECAANPQSPKIKVNGLTSVQPMTNSARVDGISDLEVARGTSSLETTPAEQASTNEAHSRKQTTSIAKDPSQDMELDDESGFNSALSHSDVEMEEIERLTLDSLRLKAVYQAKKPVSRSRSVRIPQQNTFTYNNGDHDSQPNGAQSAVHVNRKGKGIARIIPQSSSESDNSNDTDVLQSQSRSRTARRKDASTSADDTSGAESSPVEVISTSKPASFNKGKTVTHPEGLDVFDPDLPFDENGMLIDPLDSDVEDEDSLRSQGTSQTLRHKARNPLVALPTSPRKRFRPHKVAQNPSKLSTSSSHASLSKLSKSIEPPYCDAPRRDLPARQSRSTRSTREETADGNVTDYDDLDSFSRPSRRKSDLNRKARVSKTAARAGGDEDEPARPETKPQVKHESFLQLSASTGEAPLTAAEIIAKMRASRAVEADGEIPELDVKQEDSRPAMSSIHADDDDDDDLADPSALIKSALEIKAKPRPKSPSPPPLPKVKLKPLPEDTGKFSLNNMQRMREREARRGWFGLEEAKRAIDTTTDAALIGDHSSDDERTGHDIEDEADLPDIKPSAKRGGSRSIVQRARSDSAEVMKRIADGLQGDDDRETLKAIQAAKDDIIAAEKELAERSERSHRSFWHSVEHFPMEVAALVQAQFAQAENIQGTYSLQAILNPSSYPSLSRPAPDTGPDLFRLLAHPNTKAEVAYTAGASLSHLMRTASTETSNNAYLIDVHSIVSAFRCLGGKVDDFYAGRNDILPDETCLITQNSTPGPNDHAVATFNSDGRCAAVLRLLEVLDDIVGQDHFRPWSDSIVIMLLRLHMSPEDNDIRDCALRSLHGVLATLQPTDVRGICDKILQYLEGASLQHAYNVVAFLGSKTAVTKDIRRILVQEILLPSTRPIADAISREQNSPRMLISQHLLSPTSVFAKIAKLSDVDINYAALLLGLLMADATDTVLLAGNSEEQQAAIQEVQMLVIKVRRIEGRIRTDVRAGTPMRTKAKNSLTRVLHGLEIRLKAASAKVSKAARDALYSGPVDFVGENQLGIAGFLRKREVGAAVKVPDPVAVASA